MYQEYYIQKIVYISTRQNQHCHYHQPPLKKASITTTSTTTESNAETIIQSVNNAISTIDLCTNTSLSIAKITALNKIQNSINTPPIAHETT